MHKQCASTSPRGLPWRNERSLQVTRRCIHGLSDLKTLGCSCCYRECTKTANFFSASARSTLPDFSATLSSCASSSSRDHLSIAKCQQRTTRHGECRRDGSGPGPCPANHTGSRQTASASRRCQCSNGARSLDAAHEVPVLTSTWPQC